MDSKNKCNYCGETIKANCDWRQGRCPHISPMIKLENVVKAIERWFKRG